MKIKFKLKNKVIACKAQHKIKGQTTTDRKLFVAQITQNAMKNKSVRYIF